MILFLIKSAACMAIFLIFYKLFLEKESMHFFKRYFLLAAIAISLVIPAVVFTEVIYIEPISTSFTPTEDYSLETYHAPSIESIDYTYWSLLSIYGLGVLFFSLQFFNNLYQIKNTIQNNPKQQTNSIIKVLLSLQIVPHTFFNYIFLNKQKFEANEIPPAVLLHEETHAKQKHSIDILVLEILQIVFWFNPLIYLFKKSIKLNHEFLADSAVLNNGLEKSDYQKILLAFSSNAAEPQLANAINYSSIKKRFTVMKKETSRKMSLVKSFLIIPITAILLLGFSEKEILEIQKEGSVQEQKTLLNSIKKELENVNALKLNYTEEKEQIIELYIKKNAEILIHNTPVLLKDLAVTIENDIQPDIKLKNVRIEGLTEETLESEYMLSISTEIRKANIKQIKFYTSEYIMAAEDYKDKIEITPETVILNASKINLQPNKIIEYNNLAKKYNAIPIEKRVIPLKDLIILETIYRNMSPAQKEAAQPFPECLLKVNQEGATKKQISTYNDLAKKYNTMMAKDENIRIMKSDVDQLNHIYGLMSEEQKASAQPFPDFPEPPPSPKAPKTPNTSDFADKEIKRIIKTQDPYDTNTITIIKPSGVNAPKAPMAPRVKKGDKNDIPPPPLTEKIEIIQTAVDEVIENQDIIAVENIRVYRHNVDEKSANSPNLMEDLQSLAKRDAQFYFNGKEVSTKEGLQIVKNKKNIYVETLPSSNKKPKVKIYTNKNDVSIPPPPAPPTPPSPLDYVINAAKKGATFMYKGKIVSSDKAIDLLKNNKELNIESRNKNGKLIVRITKDPVTIE
ncbi:MAG: M56 family metallopeptidase [Maribacter arcticus]|uniref:M56 family metallopeptidase n=1 Tax=Maribacter arcticus TaxID=561365 RepID=UPI003001BD53